MTINSTTNQNINLDITQNKGNADKVLERLAALHTVDNSSPADLIAYNEMQSGVLQSSQKIQNANQSMAMLQISDSGLQSIRDNAQQLNELSVRRNSDALNSDQKAMLDTQADATVEAMKDVVSQTSYNGQRLLSDMNFDSLNISDQESIEQFSQGINQRLSDVGSAMGALESTIAKESAMMENLAAAKENKEYDAAELVNSFQTDQNKLDAALFARSHSADFLAKQVGTLLG